MIKDLNLFNVLPIWGLFLVTAAVVLLSLDRPFAGMITVDQQAMVALRQSMDIIGTGPAAVPPAKHSAR